MSRSPRPAQDTDWLECAPHDVICLSPSRVKLSVKLAPNDLCLCGAKHKAGPILMPTARGEDPGRVPGLEMGADHCLVKPFAARELLARIRAVLGRSGMLAPNMRATDGAQMLQFGGWRVDTATRHLLDDSGLQLALSGAEYRLLRVFLDHPQRVLSRDPLPCLTQGRDAELFERSIDLLVSRLRQRPRDDAREPRYIKTVPSEGYVFATGVEAID